MNVPPLSCRLCEVTFDNATEQRRHLKDEWHVYKLRCQVASPGTTVVPPSEQHGDRDLENGSSEEYAHEGTDESGDEDDSDDGRVGVSLEFLPGQCLFCAECSDSFDANIAHMKKTHSFTIPHQPTLLVDVETLMWYLQLVIFGYHECLLCSKRRRSLEAVQQHMLAKGHCRFEVTEEYADFYDLDALIKGFGDSLRPDETTLRLPSGKLLLHRSQTAAANPRSSHPSTTQQQQPLPVTTGEGKSAELVTRLERRLGTNSMQLSRLSASDQMSLLHLSAAEQRSVLATRKRQLDTAQREERRARSKVERLGNRTLMKHFKNDVPGRSNG